MARESSPSLTIVGGSYREHCDFPQWSQYFGSGLRAACAISNRDVSVQLRTYVSRDDRRLLETIAATFAVDVQAEESPGSFSFEYRHSLAQPIWSHTGDVFDVPPLEVEGESILAFGMLEGSPIINGGRVVFDPQSPNDPIPFDQNESEADELAIVANATEARRLSQEDDLDDAGRKLLEKAQVVVIKNGVRGAHVFTSSGVNHVPAFRTRNVFLIGSGDVFSATFAYAWLHQRQDPLAAAELASRATAFYCDSATLPIPSILPSAFHPEEIAPVGSPVIYLAGPFFSPEQLDIVEEARSQLIQQGATVFSPYHDVGLGRPETVAEADLDALRSCDAVFAILTSYDPGTVFEVGFAAALGKRVVGFIGSTDPKNTTMFVGSGCELFEDFVSAIYNAVWM